MPRLFTGLEVLREASQELSLVRGGLEGARWIEPEDYHITLKFIGDVDDSTANELILGFEKIESGLIEIRIVGFGVFGGKKPYNLYASVELNEDLLNLQQQHEGVLKRIGLGLEQRKFMPHVTLARFRGIKLTEIAKWMESKGNFSELRYTAERSVLYSAKDSVGGGPYVVEAGYPFFD